MCIFVILRKFRNLRDLLLFIYLFRIKNNLIHFIYRLEIFICRYIPPPPFLKLTLARRTRQDPRFSPVGKFDAKAVSTYDDTHNLSQERHCRYRESRETKPRFQQELPVNPVDSVKIVWK